MKKPILMIITISLLAGGISARKPIDKAGDIENFVFTDKKFNYSLQLNDVWTDKIMKNKDNYRLVLIKKKYEIPPDYIDAPDYTTIPRINLWVDTTSMSPFAFIDSLLSNTYSSEQKNELFKEFDILNDNISEGGNVREELITRQKKAFNIGEYRALSWTGKMKYRKEVAESASAIGGKRVIGAYGGAIIGVKKGKHIYLFHLMCEWNYFDINYSLLMDVVNSMKWE
jgi:hypothetical protein